MTLQRVPVKWPTDDDRLKVESQLQTAHDVVEDAVYSLERAAPSDTPEQWPDPTPTLETVGGIYDLLETVRSHAHSLERFSKRLEKTIDDVNLVRLNYPLAVFAAEEQAHA